MENLKGLTKIEIQARYAQDYSSPLDEPNLWKLLMFHKQYNFGDKSLFDGTAIPSYSSFTDWDEIKKWIINHVEDAIIVPIYMTNDSDILFSTGTSASYRLNPLCWGQIGFAITCHSVIKERFNIDQVTKKYEGSAKKILEKELNKYQAYVNGEVYDLVVSFYTEEGIKTYCASDFFGWDDVEQFISDLQRRYKKVPVILLDEYI